MVGEQGIRWSHTCEGTVVVNAMNGTQASLRARKPDVMRRGQEGIPEEVVLNSLYLFLKRPAVGLQQA